MGYESRIYICAVSRHKTLDDFGLILGMFDLCKMGYNGFHDLFAKEIDFDIYIDDGDIPTTEDAYGDKLRYTNDIEAVINYCIEDLSNVHYRREWIFWKALEAIKESIDRGEWGKKEICLVHYGY